MSERDPRDVPASTATGDRAAPLVAIVGPTCTGKTALAVALAGKLRRELINADSRQLRRGLRVGTCAPTAEELRGVPCHLLDEADPGETYTVAHWLARAAPLVDRLHAEGVLPIVVGGTGLYVTALVDGYDLGSAPPDPSLRSERTERAATAAGLEELAAELSRRDPDAVATVDTRNPRRLIRALEILDANAGPLRAARGSTPRRAAWIGLDAPGELHAEWIQRRCAAMFAGGAIVDEVSAALARGCGADALGDCGIGYAEALAVHEGRITVEEAVTATVRRTLRYARSQRSYFRRDARVQWLSAAAAPDALLRDALALIAGVTAARQDCDRRAAALPSDPAPAANL
jgi:tRNA dimethylallyltransferase